MTEEKDKKEKNHKSEDREEGVPRSEGSESEIDPEDQENEEDQDNEEEPGEESEESEDEDGSTEEEVSGEIDEKEEAKESGRERHIVVMFGINGMGKSYLAKQLKRQFRNNHPNSPIYSISKRMPGALWVHKANIKKQLMFPLVLELTNDGYGPIPGQVSPRVPMEGALIELDDGDTYVPSNIENTPWYEFFTENRHLRLDIILTAHRPQRISKDIIGAAHHIFIFKMGENYAYDYLMELPSIRSSALDPEDDPKRVGEYIHIIQDPRSNDPAKVQKYKPPKEIK